MGTGWRRWADYAWGYNWYRRTWGRPRMADPEQAGDLCDELLDRLNRLRGRRQLLPLIRNSRLDEAAIRLAEAMACEMQLAYDVGGALYSLRLTEVHYRALNGGECIAAGLQTPRELLTSWLGDQAVCRNLFGEFRHVGIGVGHDAWGQRYWCLDLANQRPHRCQVQLTGLRHDLRRRTDKAED